MTPAGRMLRPYLLRRWRALAGAGGATAVLAIADLAKPWPLALVVDQVLGRTAPFELTGSDTQLLVAMAALVLTIAVAEALARYASDLWLQAAGERITHDLRVTVYDHLQRLSLGFHQQRQKGDLLTRVTGDVNAMGEVFSQSVGSMVEAALLAIGMTVVMFVIDPVLALVALATTPLLAALSVVYRRRVRSQARVRRTEDGRIASVASEALAAMSVVKAYGSERFESDRVRERSAQRMVAGVAVVRLQARFDGLVGSVRAVGTAAVLVAGVLQVANGAISPGELLVFVSYTRKAHGPMRSFAREATKLAAAMARAERIAELLAADEVIEDRPGAYRGPRAAGEVAFEGVSFGYGSGRPVLDDVSIRIGAGERIALMGPSGAGKSTLAALIARFHDPPGGRVLLDGRDLRDCSLEWLREQVAIVLQDTILFSGTVHENIAYAGDATRGEVVAVARAAAAHEFIAGLPDGYDTELGPQGVALSGGQRQRLGIARTLLRDPPILLLDEPTTGLDADSEAAVLDGLETLMAGRTTVLITHSPRLARTAERVVVLDGGRIARPQARTNAAEPVLPLDRLLDPDEMRAALSRALGDGAELGDVAVSRVVYKPHDTLAVHYRAGVGGAPHDVVATSIAGVDLAARAARPRYAELARRVDARSPAAAAVSYDDRLGALVTWLPFDPKLPALAEDGRELARRLRRPGMDEPSLIGYKPRARAVLRAGRYVLKAYGRTREFEAALTGLVTASRQGAVPTARFEGVVPELRLTAQRAVDGHRPDSAAEVAAAAGELVAALQRAPVAALAPALPERHLESAARKADLIGTLIPSLRPRLDGLLDALGAELPAGVPLVPAHGDFHVDQLLIGPGGIAVIDFDQMCLAAPALDIATYAADVVRGRDRDLALVRDVVEAMLDGYGQRPEALDWHLSAAILGRAAHPFHRQVPHWPERVEAMVAAAEAARG